MSRPAAIVIMRHRCQFAVVVAEDHMLHGYLVCIRALTRGGGLLVLDPDGTEILVHRSDVQVLGRKIGG